MRRPFAFLFALGLLAAPMAAQAMALSINHSARLNIAGTASSVIVGNPAVADVNVVDSHTVYVVGRGYGSTDVVVLDKSGHALFKQDVTVGGSERTITLYRGAERTSIACDPGCGEAGAKPTPQPDAVANSTNAMVAATGQGAQNVGSSLAPMAASPPPSPPHP